MMPDMRAALSVPCRAPRVAIYVLLSLASGCGGGGGAAPAAAHPEAAPFDGQAYLYEYALENVPLLVPGEGKVEAAERALRRAGNADARRGAMRDLAFAHVVAAEGLSEADARRHRREALRLVQRASQRNRNEDQVRDLRFLRAWNAYRSGSSRALELFVAFTARFQDHAEITRLAWMLRGELAFTREDWAGARDGFRFVMASLDHPLYRFALYRTAQIDGREGHAEEGRRALEDVRDRACRSDATEADRRFGRYAWEDLHDPPAPATPPADGRPPFCAAAPEPVAAGFGPSER
jgi:hypothetical protein